MKKIYTTLSLVVLGLGVALAQNPVSLRQLSVTPSLVTVSLPGVSAFGLISSDDILPMTPSFKFGGMADGAGIVINNAAVVSKNVTATKGSMATVTGMYNPKGTYVYLTNHEDNLGVSRQFYDETFKPVAGDYAVNSNAGYWRLCSGTMATPEEHGFGPVFFSGGESGIESLVLAVDPFENPNFANLSPTDSINWANKGYYMSNWGRWSTENAVPLHKDAYPGKVVIILGDDDFENNSQVVAIVGDLADFQNKNYNKVKVYALRRSIAGLSTLSGDDLDKATFERGVTVGNVVDVEFVEIPNIVTMTGKAINTYCDANNVMKFGRVEDIDFRKSATAPGTASKELYFAVTGQVFGSAQNPLDAAFAPITFPGFWNGTDASYGQKGYTSFNATITLPSSLVLPTSAGKTMFGRVYKLKLNETDPLKGQLSVVWDGDAKTNDAADIKNFLMNCDNVTATEDYLYVQEDPNRYSGGGQTVTTLTGLPPIAAKFLFNYENHDSRIYQMNMNTGQIKILLEQDHRRLAADNIYYNQGVPPRTFTFANPNPTGTSFTPSRPGDWEFGALVNVSKETGVPGAYILCNQPHSWQSLNYIRPDGGSRPTPDGYRLEASNLIMLAGLPENTSTGFSMAAETPTWFWYNTSVGGTAIASGKNFVTSVTGNMTYYVAYGTTLAKSARREPVSIIATEPVVLSTESFEEASSFNVFPNPNNGTFTLTFDAKSASTIKVEIYDINGKLVYLDNVSTAGVYSKAISVGGKGTFVAVISANGKSATKKVVVE
ncbi:MAG: T9SS type A sorting domain-containing protein [Cytophagales bacterium]